MSATKTIRKKRQPKSELSIQPAVGGSQEQIALILERVSDGFVALDRDWCFNFVNERAANIFGRKREDLIGKHIWTEFPEGIGQPFYKAYYQAVETQQPVFLEEYFIPHNRWFENRIYPSKDGLSIFFQDITDRKHLEEDLRKSEEKFYKSFHNTPDAVSLTTLVEGRIVEANESFLHFCGYTMDDLIDRTTIDLDMWADPSKRQHYVDLLQTEGQVTNLEADFRLKSGEIMNGLISGEMIELHNDKYILNVIHDVTELKRSEETLRISVKKFSKAFYSCPDSMAIATLKEGRLVEVNDSFLVFGGYKREDVIGRTTDELGAWVLPEERERIFGIIQSEVKVRNVELEFRTKSGEIRTGLFSAESIEIGDEPCILSVVRDITERKRAEEEIRKINTELELRVAERTAQLLNANKDLESFSYSVSHDLRAPLRAINGFAEIVSRRHRANLNDEGQHYIDNIVLASERMGQLIDSLLAYSRLGRKAVQLQPVVLGDVLESVVSDLAERLVKAGADLQIADDLPVVRGDPTLLNEIFTNLLDNAITYRRQNVSLLITVTAQRQHPYSIVRVADNGIGIPPEYHQKIFEVFQRLHSESEYPGTGIGLAIVKKSVEMLGGKVWVESVVGEGSTFCVRLDQERGLSE